VVRGDLTLPRAMPRPPMNHARSFICSYRSRKIGP
jgi:hypothetical protein